MADKDTLVHVEIFGQDYAVRGGDDPAYVEKLAAFVDNRMKEINQTSAAVDTLRIAVLAALNVADECFRLREELSEAEGRSQVAGQAADQRVARLAETLGAALGD